MGYKRWDHVEDTILRVWCDQESCEQLAERLNRSVGSVKSRLQTLGIKKKNIYPNRVWTKEMEKLLKTKAGNQSTKSIARLLKMPVNRVKLKANRMGVSLRTKKYRLWTEGEMERLEKSLHLCDWTEIAEKVGRTEDACRKKASEIGLNLDQRRDWTTKDLKLLHEGRLNGMSYKRIAKKLNRTESSVRKRYARYKKECNLT
jgi:DNA-binding CsgD family transcriptional regulator